MEHLSVEDQVRVPCNNPIPWLFDDKAGAGLILGGLDMGTYCIHPELEHVCT